jgi:hypothetical protein
VTLSFTRTDLPTAGRRVRSLVWRGDELVDWVAGGHAYLLDGARRDRHVSYSYRFDAATTSPSGRYAVIYERLGTKGLLLRDGDIVRELNRSFYHADVYEYPVCLLALPDGRDVIAHCPDSYCDVVIEDAETGARLTVPDTGDKRSFFHSRLAASPDGRYLLTAGWIWHPFDTVLVWELNPGPDKLFQFHEPDKDYQGESEVASAAFTSDGALLVCSASGADNFIEQDELTADHLSPMSLGRWNFATNVWDHLVTAADEVGTLMPVGDRYAVGFYDCPKVFDLTTGAVVQRWPDLRTGRQLSSIVHHLKPADRPPTMALDPQCRRFAVLSGERISVIQFT